jgi:hypothetical protein
MTPVSCGYSIVDSFNRTAGTLGVADTGQWWSLYAGTLGTMNSASYNPSWPNFGEAVIDSLVPNGVASMTVLDLHPDGNLWLVFRFKDGINNWSVEAVPAYYVVQCQVAGSFVFRKIINRAPVPGDTVSAAFTGPSISILINGTLVDTETDQFFTTQTREGFAIYRQSAEQQEVGDYSYFVNGGCTATVTNTMTATATATTTATFTPTP